MEDILDIFYRDIESIFKEYKASIISKNFVDKTGEIELIPINMAKGEIIATKKLQLRISDLYKKYKTELNTIE